MDIYNAIETLIKKDVVDYNEIRHILTSVGRKELLKPYEIEDLIEQAKKMDSCEGW